MFFPNLDGLRFLAFFLVYLQHGFGLANAAGAGVAFFFVLSGFLITHLILEEVEMTGHVDILAFYARRALRIWPLYFAVLLFAFVIYPGLKVIAGLSGYIQNGGPLLYVLFLSNFDVLRMPLGQGAGSTNVTWSVAVEEQFYLLWPLLFRFVPRNAYVFIFPTVISISFWFRLSHQHEGLILYFHSLSVISDMAVGGMAAYFWRSVPLFRHFIARLSTGFLITVYVVAIVFMYVAKGFWGPYSRIAAALFFAFVVLEQNFCVHSFFKMSRSALLSELGRYTYGLYLLHSIVLTLQQKAATLSGADRSAMWPWVEGILGLVLSVGLARLSFFYFEAPFLKWKDRFSRVGSAPLNRSADLLINTFDEHNG